MALAHGSTNSSLDPALYNDNFGAVVLAFGLSNPLAEIDAEGNVLPDLAESWSASEDLTVWTVKMRPGLVFHDGTDVTAADVVASIRHHMGENSKSVAKSVVATIESVEDVDGDVVITLSGGNIDFPYVLADNHLVVMPSKDGVVDWKSGIRTGPYMLESFEPGVRTVLRRNPNYHKPERAHFESVEVLSVADVTARTNALVGGSVQYVDRCDVRTAALLRRNKDVTILESQGPAHYGFVMNTTAAPFDKVEIRQAVKYSLNREEIFQKIFGGVGKLAEDNPVASNLKFAAEVSPSHAYNPEKSRELLAAAGVDRLPIEIHVSDTAFTGAVDAAILWQQHAKDCGIDLTVVRAPGDNYWSDTWMKKPLTASYWSGRANIDAFFSTFYAPDAAWNDGYWKHPRFTEILVQGRVEKDEAKRAALYAEAQQLIHDDAGLINLAFGSVISAHVPSLQHDVIATDRTEDGGRLLERWWFADQ